MRTDLREKRREQRLERIDEGVELLTRWLEDLARQGLGRLGERGLDLEGMARRLMDCQAQGLARRVQALARLRPERTGAVAPLLLELGQLALACEGWRRRHELGPLGATIERVVGLTLTEAQALEVGERVEDAWLVLGQRVEHDPDTRFTTTRTWLLGARSRRTALHLAYAWGDEGFAEARARDRFGFDERLRASPEVPSPESDPPLLVPGKVLAATLAFFPNALPQRVAFAEVQHASFPRRRLRVSLRGGLDEAVGALADALAVDPFVDCVPVVLGDVRLALAPPAQPGDPPRAAIVDGDRALPLTPVGAHDLLTLAAVTGGAAFDLVAEWDGRALSPLAVLTDAGLTPLTRPGLATQAPRPVPLDPELAALERLATLGTAAAPAPGPSPLLGPLTAPLAALPAEPALLLRAACHGLARRAGARPVMAPEPVPEAPPEPRPEAQGTLVGALARALSEPALHPELAAALDARGLRLPAELLPRVLAEASLTHDALRPAFGARVAWLEGLGLTPAPPPPTPARPLDELLQRLAGQDPGGAPVPFPDRLEALARARALDPDRARAALEPILPTERPEHRRALVEALGSTLVGSDLPLVERLSKDRAKTVRAAATELAQRLPESAVAQRIAARARETLRLVGDHLALRYPTHDEHWAADGLGDGPIGALASLEATLVHLVERVPPSLWEAHLARTPADIVRLLWHVDPQIAREPLYAGLAAATVRFGTPTWIEPLWLAFATLGGPPPLALFVATPRSERRRLAELRVARAGQLREGDERLFAHIPRPFGPALSQAVLDAVAPLNRTRGVRPHPLAEVFGTLALGLDPPALTALLARPELPHLREARQLAQTRLLLHQELADA